MENNFSKLHEGLQQLLSSQRTSAIDMTTISSSTLLTSQGQYRCSTSSGLAPVPFDLTMGDAGPAQLYSNEDGLGSTSGDCSEAMGNYNADHAKLHLAPISAHFLNADAYPSWEVEQSTPRRTSFDSDITLAANVLDMRTAGKESLSPSEAQIKQRFVDA